MVATFERRQELASQAGAVPVAGPFLVNARQVAKDWGIMDLAGNFYQRYLLKNCR